eukprot:3319372-Pyramimonas_sp.AAC.1
MLWPRAAWAIGFAEHGVHARNPRRGQPRSASHGGGDAQILWPAGTSRDAFGRAVQSSGGVPDRSALRVLAPTRQRRRPSASRRRQPLPVPAAGAEQRPARGSL